MTEEQEERFFARVLALSAQDPQLRADRIRRDAMLRARRTIAELRAKSVVRPAPDKAPT
jgi:hypothetical protein